MKNTITRIIEIATIVSLSLCLYPFFYYNKITENIPLHYNVIGEVDAWGNKSIFWVITIVAFIIYIGLKLLQNRPDIFNYPTTITKQNKDRLYSLGTEMLRVLNLILCTMFSYINITTVRIALHDKTSLSTSVIILFIVLVVTIPIIYIKKMRSSLP